MEIIYLIRMVDKKPKAVKTTISMQIWILVTNQEQEMMQVTVKKVKVVMMCHSMIWKMPKILCRR